MMNKITITALMAAEAVMAYPFVADMPGVNKGALPRRSVTMGRRQAPTVCNFTPSNKPAAPITSQYPYLGAINGKPGTGKGNILVPAKGDVAHYYQEPGPNDIRGPCPGINTMANHGFIARSGIVTYNELVDAQQNVFNVGYDLANLLAIAGVGLDGDLVGTTKLSIGCSDNAATASAVNPLADELGLDGHNHFEADTSLTRNDFFLGNGDNHSWNATLFKMMMDVCDGDCNLQTLGEYRYQRYQQSKADNPNFFFGPGSVLLYGAATFLYELFPTNGGKGDPATMMSFFGANQTSDGNYVFNGGERIPPNWFSRTEPYNDIAVGNQLIAMYLEHPVLFGGNVGAGNFDAMNYSGIIENGQLKATTGPDALCLIYQSLTGGFPSELGKVLNLGAALEDAITSKLSPSFQNFGCPIDYNKGSS